ncbi:DNA helicase RecD, partial [Streptomyces fulvissimus]|nr:DNA helicase RecD [Streptomyces microflavus]
MTALPGETPGTVGTDTPQGVEPPAATDAEGPAHAEAPDTEESGGSEESGGAREPGEPAADGSEVDTPADDAPAGDATDGAEAGEASAGDASAGAEGDAAAAAVLSEAQAELAAQRELRERIAKRKAEKDGPVAAGGKLSGTAADLLAAVRAVESGEKEGTEFFDSPAAAPAPRRPAPAP